MASLKNRRHDDIITRWFAVRTPGNRAYGADDYDTDHIASLDMSHDWRLSGAAMRDELRSYGPHFPLVNAIRDSRTGKPRLFLLNGDRYMGASGFGMSTSSQQAEVRRLAEASGIPTLILPRSAWQAAGIDMDSIRPIAVDADEWHSWTFTSESSETPADAEWVPTHELVDGTSYYGTRGYASFDDIPADIRAYFDAEGRPLPEYRIHRPTRVSFGRTHTDWNAHAPARDYVSQGDSIRQATWGEKLWEVPTVYRYTGRKLTGAQGDYTQTPDGRWTQRRQTHQLGQATFRAAYRPGNGKRYFADFLSGVDNTPHGSGYFLVQLPKGADSSTVAGAIASLKPGTVRIAEAAGIEVMRQGDLYAIPTDYTLRDLRKLGADIRQSSKASESRRAAIQEEWNEAFLSALRAEGIPRAIGADIPMEKKQRRADIRADFQTRALSALREWDASHRVHTQRGVLGTRHEGTEVAILPNGAVLARGTLRHTGGQHRMLSLGKTWHVIVRNTVPLARTV